MSDPQQPSVTPEVAGAVRMWRNGLVNLTRSNRALHFRATKTASVAITTPSMGHVFETLRTGGDCEVRGVAEDGAEPAVVASRAVFRNERPAAEVRTVVRNIGRRAHQELVDRGLSVVYVAFGFLHWVDSDDSTYISPIVLVPVDVSGFGSKGIPHFATNGEDIVINPSLVLRMQGMDIVFPQIGFGEDIGLGALLDGVRDAVAQRHGWSVTEGVVVSSFSFQKEAMYRDLIINEQVILENPIVQALANQDPSRQDIVHLFDPIAAGDIDREMPADKIPLILDADSSQRVCIAAALLGKSFVMDGPPGTGKSQTIANIIGALMHEGKTVLFVSEKMAALEVVRDRLAHVGLGDYVLELHSHKASRKDVAVQLGSAVDGRPGERSRMPTNDFRTLRVHGDRLSAYAEAMNQIRQPLGRSLHDVLGEISILRNVAAAPSPQMAYELVSDESISRMAYAAQRLARAWRPVQQGDSFIWRDVVERRSLDADLEQSLAALRVLADVAEHHGEVRRTFDLLRVDDLPDVARLLHHWASKPGGASDDWLLLDDVSQLRQAVDDMTARLKALRASAARFQTRYGVTWDKVPDPASLPQWPVTITLDPPPVNTLAMYSHEARGLADQFARDVEMLQRVSSGISRLAQAMGLRPVESIQDVDVVLDLADTMFVPHRPLRDWLSIDGLSSAREAAQVIRQHLADANERSAEAQRWFSPDALSAPLAELHQRFQRTHRGIRKLFSAYRQDKVAVAAITAPGAQQADAVAHLPVGIEWLAAEERLRSAESHYASRLGSYWKGRDTDFPSVAAALDVAGRIIDLSPPESLASVSSFVTSANPDEAVHSLVLQVRTDVRTWRMSLASPPAYSARPELLFMPIADAVAWMRTQIEPLRNAAERAHVVSAATAKSVTTLEASTILDIRKQMDDERSDFLDRSPRYDETLSSVMYAGLDTDLESVAQALAWTNDMRTGFRFAGEKLRSEQLDILKRADTGVDVLPHYLSWQRVLRPVMDAFAPSRHVEIMGELSVFESAKSFLTELLADNIGQDEWFQFVDARTDLDSLGARRILEFCQENQIPPHQVEPVMRRAVLRAWADYVLTHNSELEPLLSRDRDELIDEFRVLDRRAIATAPAEVIRAVNARGPRMVDIGEPGLLRREGMKRSRHLPVRDLIQRTVRTTQAIKPCFMMSPLAVSQYLPSDMRFDVVIFDEASQVTPGDAVNCIYRGRSVITAGDDRQLPPTSFFDRMTFGDDEEATDITDFQSVLELMKACGAFRNLGLRWHYRSRHESLISFSNRHFYEGRLVTFPGAVHEHQDLGVELFHVDGVYGRGTTGDNPIEAVAVAERVRHHYETRPDSSLGVVTFSMSQANAIQAEVDRIMDENPHLARQRGEERLSGLFVKSLESVQGDERDVMLMSVGYGPDSQNRISSNFGPLNRDKGWRRLNVAVTRARNRVEVVTSLRARDIPASDNESVRYLINYLEFAERGGDRTTLSVVETGRRPESPLEESVIDALQDWGYEIEPQVGASEYRIDIAVRHPNKPQIFMLGIECDGYMYHSSPAARDRDRIRDQVLAGLGWRLHRLWGTAWHRNRAHEEQRLKDALRKAVNAPIVGRLASPEIAPPVAFQTGAPARRVLRPAWIQPYTYAVVDPLPSWVTPSSDSSIGLMQRAIEGIALHEGPVHADVVFQRLRESWSIGRVGSVIRGNMEYALSRARVDLSGAFVSAAGRHLEVVRGPDIDGNVRSIHHVADEEVVLAYRCVVADVGSVLEDELHTKVARTFGWGRRGSDIQQRLESVLQQMIASGVVILDQGTVRTVS